MSKGISLSEAIKILTTHPIPIVTESDHAFFNAIKLSIEAMKWYKEHCSHFVAGQFKLLPGETEE